MRDKIQLLIEASRALDGETKDRYLKMLKFMPETALQDLLSILEKEATEAEKLEKQLQLEEANFYESSLAELEKTYKDEYKAAVTGEEGADENSAEDLLKQLES